MRKINTELEATTTAAKVATEKKSALRVQVHSAAPTKTANTAKEKNTENKKTEKEKKKTPAAPAAKQSVPSCRLCGFRSVCGAKVNAPACQFRRTNTEIKSDLEKEKKECTEDNIEALYVGIVQAELTRQEKCTPQQLMILWTSGGILIGVVTMIILGYIF